MSWPYFFLFVLIFDPAFTLESRVFGGDDLRFEVHKYLVRLKIFHARNTATCSGSIVDRRWVISSAHCFIGGEKRIRVYHHVDGVPTIIAKVEMIYRHPDYNPTLIRAVFNKAFDIALLRTTPIRFSDYVQPIKLSANYPRNGQSAIIAGFGESEADMDPPREGLVAIEWCRFGVPGLLCSEDTVRAGSGDSGGSLISRGKLIGVTSASCKNVQEPKVCVTVYTSVATNLKWLKEVLLQE